MAKNNMIPMRSEAVNDQYADGRAAKVWDIFVGDKSFRINNYKNFLVKLLNRKGCKRILDAACGTGTDSIFLLEEGYEVVSVDASDKMLKYALKTRWSRRKEPAFDNWVIEEANWLTLFDDIEEIVGNGFDAIICFGNSFAHLLDNYGDQREQKTALRNFEKCLKPGGLLLIDHRNFDDIIETGRAATRNIFYNCRHKLDIKTSISFDTGRPPVVTLDYLLDISANKEDDTKINRNKDTVSEYRFFYYPHRLEVFKRMLKEAFGEYSEYRVYGDFKHLEDVDVPNYYIHVVEKSSIIF